MDAHLNIEYYLSRSYAPAKANYNKQQLGASNLNGLRTCHSDDNSLALN